MYIEDGQRSTGENLHAKIQITPSLDIPEHELAVYFTRSGGPGGQNVNKVSTRVELRFDVRNSSSLTTEQKERIAEKLRSRIDRDGVLHIASQESRSQWKNREIAIAKFSELLRAALAVRKKRKPTKPPTSSKQSRLLEKKQRGVRKKLRGPVHPSTD